MTNWMSRERPSRPQHLVEGPLGAQAMWPNVKSIISIRSITLSPIWMTIDNCQWFSDWHLRRFKIIGRFPSRKALFARSVRANFSLNTRTVRANFGLIARSPVYFYYLVKIRKCTSHKMHRTRCIAHGCITYGDHHHDDDRIVHKWWWSSSWWWSHRTQMMMIIIVMMIASYTNDVDWHHHDDRIVHEWWWSS